MKEATQDGEAQEVRKPKTFAIDVGHTLKIVGADDYVWRVEHVNEGKNRVTLRPAHPDDRVMDRLKTAADKQHERQR